MKETEKGFQAAILELAQRCGWLSYFTWRSIHSPAGFPDLVLCRPPRGHQPGRLVFAEVKIAQKQPTPAQQDWLEALSMSVPGVECYLWRPTDWDGIVTLLRR